MDLAPEQYFVYAWRYTDDTVCKLGVSTLRTFYARIKAAKTVTYQDIELLGIEVFGTEAEARDGVSATAENVCAGRGSTCVGAFRCCCPAVDRNRVYVQPSDSRCFLKMPFRMIRRVVKRSARINVGLRKNGRRETVPPRNPVRNARRRIALMSGNMLGSGGKMTLHIRRNRCSVRRRGERRTRIMIKSVCD